MIRLLAALAVCSLTAANAADQKRLTSDVDAINAAVERYLNNGGSFGASDGAQQVLTTLRDSGAMLSPSEQRNPASARLVPIISSVAPESGRWAYWNSRQREFTLWRGPAHGNVQVITAFERLRPGEAPASGSPSIAVSVSSSRERLLAHGWTRGKAGDVRIGELKPPIIDPPGGTYNSNDFYLPVRLSNPNGPALGEIRFMLGGSGWRTYRGETIQVRPGSEIIAFCAPRDSLTWSESGPALAQYRIQPIRLEVTLETPAGSLQPAALDSRAASDALLPAIALSYPASVPPAYRNGEFIEFAWTADGSDPRSSSSAVLIELDSAGRATEPLRLSRALLGEAEAVLIRAAARSKNRNVLLDSEPISELLRVER